MKIAVFYTGCLRTFDRTLPYNMKHLLVQSDTTVEVHVFACVQNDRPQPNHVMAQRLTDLLTPPGQNNTLLCSLEWFYPDDPHCRLWIETQIENLDFEGSDYWKDYLKTSGSMVEYVQLYRCWRQMTQQELYTKEKYEYVVRLRTDVVLANYLDFSTLPDTPKTMNGLLHWLSPGRQQVGEMVDIQELFPENDGETPDMNRWILAIRKNVFYVMPRLVADTVATLGHRYATIQPNTEKQKQTFSVWFDAESQLHLICIQNGITVFNSTTRLEGESLYEFKRYVYFDYNETEEYLKPSDQYVAFIYRPYYGYCYE